MNLLLYMRGIRGGREGNSKKEKGGKGDRIGGTLILAFDL